MSKTNVNVKEKI